MLIRSNHYKTFTLLKAQTLQARECDLDSSKNKSWQPFYTEDTLTSTNLGTVSSHHPRQREHFKKATLQTSKELKKTLKYRGLEYIRTVDEKGGHEPKT